MRKKMMSVLLALAMVLTLLPATALAEGSSDLVIDGKTYAAVSADRMETSLVSGVTGTVQDGAVNYLVSKTDTSDWDQNSGVGSVQSYTYVGLYVTIPEGATKLMMNDEGNPGAMAEVSSSFLQGGKFQQWFPIADKQGDGYSLFNGGREYVVLLDWYNGEELIKSEYVKVTRNLAAPAAQIGTTTYETLAGAVAAVVASESKTGMITLLRDVVGSGIGLFESKGASNVNLTIDFGGHTYTCADPAVGSTGTESQGFHLEKGNKVTLQNGVIAVSDDSTKTKMLIQNYCDLTLNNLTLKGGNITQYIISCNYGNMELNNVSISGTYNNLVAIDLMHWLNMGVYGTKAPTMKVNNSSADVINGKIDVYCYDQTTNKVVDCEDKPALTITGGTFSVDPTQFLAGGYKVRQVNGTYSVVPQNSFIVTFDAKGGTEVAPMETNADGKLTTLPVPVLSGYVFSGWYTEDGVQVTTDTVFSADTTVYASWTYVPPYTPPTGGNTGNTGNTSTVTNPDGSTTTTVTKPDGTVTVTDKDTQGNVTETVSKPDGTSTTTVTTTNGSSSVTTMGQTGKVEAQVNLSQSAVNAADNEAVALPMASLPVTDSQAMAPVVTVDLPTGTAAAKVEVPVQNVTAGTVAILVKADGSQEIVKTSVTTESGVVLTVEDGAKVMIVDNSKDFADVPASYWGSDAVDFATSRDLFNGTSATTFDPDADMNRAMIVTVLARLEGVDTTTGSTWYEAGQQWAIEAGISDGSDLNSAVSREQLVTMLYRYAGSPAVSGVIGGYADTDSVSSWAVEAMTWAINEGIINGVGNSLDPQGDATRAQVATILMRFVATL